MSINSLQWVANVAHALLSSRWLRVAVSIALLSLLLSFVDVRRSWELLRGARLEFLALSILLILAGRLLAGYRWYILVRVRSPEVTLWDLVRLIFVSNFFGYFLPGTIGAEIVRVYTLSRVTSDLALSFSSILVERVQALLALIFLVFVGLALSPTGLLPRGVGYVAWLGLALVAIGIVVVMHPLSRSLMDRLLRGGLLAPVRSRLAKLYDRLDTYRNRPGLMAWAMVVTMVFQLLRIAEIAIMAWALGLDFPFIDFVMLMPIIILLSILPISIAGLGVREVSFVYLFGLVGMEPEAAFTLSVLSFIFGTVAALPGAWFYARGRGAEGSITKNPAAHHQAVSSGNSGLTRPSPWSEDEKEINR